MADERSQVESPHAGAPSSRPVVLTDAQCREVLARQRTCIMSVVDGTEPYAVAVFYGFDGEHLYLGISDGRKTRALDANCRVYIVVTEVGPGDAWRSVAVAGEACTLTDTSERQRAIEVLIAHNRRFRTAIAHQTTAPRRPTSGRVLRIAHAVVTGRSFGDSAPRGSPPDASHHERLAE